MTTTRQVATEANVSHALVRYHFGSKTGLRDAVDAELLGSFGQALATAREEGAEHGSLAEAGRAGALVFGADRERRRYLRRVLLDGDQRAAEREVERLLADPGEISPDDRRWAALQTLFLILGPLLLEPALARIWGEDLFAPAVLAERSAADQRLLRRGLLGGR